MMGKKSTWAMFLFLISFGVYLKTLCPTVYIGDSGELIAAAYTLGIPHPPGYPLYCLLGKLFTFLPFGSIAYRINLMSAFFASLTVVLVYLIILKIQNTGKLANWQTGGPLVNHIPAVSASLLLAFSLTFWSQAVIAEVYTLNAFFLALSILVLLKWKEKKAKGYLYSFSFIYGLSLTHHYMMGLFAPAFLLFILWTRPKIVKEAKTLFFMLGLFLLPLIVYLYLPIRSLADPPIDWGNPENWSNFLAHIMRLQYRDLEFAKSIPLKDKGLFISDFLRRLSHQFTLFLAWLGLIGIWRFFKKDKRFFSLSLLIFLANSLGLIFLLHFSYNPGNSFEFSVLYLPAYLIFALWMGCGIEYLVSRGAQLNRRVIIGFATRNSYKYLSTILILALPILPLSKNYFRNDRSRHYFAYDFGMNILKTVNRGAILVTFGEKKTFPLAYLHLVEGERSDVTIYDGPGHVFPDLYEKDRGLNRKEWQRGRDIIEKELVTEGRRPFYYTFRRDMSEIPGYILRPLGLIYKAEREGIELEEERDYWGDYQMRGIEDEEIYKDLPTRSIIAEYYYRLGKYYERRGNRKKTLEVYLKLSEVNWEAEEFHYDLGVTFHELGMYEYAILEYQRAIELRPTNAKAHNNLGVCYIQKGRYRKAKSEWEKALSINPEQEEARKNLERLKSRKE